MYSPRSSKKKREKLIKATLQCQGIKCSLGPGIEAKKHTLTELLVPIQCAVERREHEVEGGMGGSSGKRAFSK